MRVIGCDHAIAETAPDRATDGACRARNSSKEQPEDSCAPPASMNKNKIKTNLSIDEIPKWMHLKNISKMLAAGVCWLASCRAGWHLPCLPSGVILADAERWCSFPFQLMAGNWVHWLL